MNILTVLLAIIAVLALIILVALIITAVCEAYLPVDSSNVSGKKSTTRISITKCIKDIYLVINIDMPGCTSLSEIYELPDARFFAFAERLYNNHKFWRDAEESFKVPEVCQISSLMLQIRFNPRAMTPKELHEQLSGFTLESLRERLGNHFVDPA